MRISDSAPEAEILDKAEELMNKTLGVIVAAIFLSVFFWVVLN